MTEAESHSWCSSMAFHYAHWDILSRHNNVRHTRIHTA